MWLTAQAEGCVGPEGFRERMHGIKSDAIDSSLLQSLPDPCPISQTIVTDVAKGELQACACTLECFSFYVVFWCVCVLCVCVCVCVRACE